MDLKIYYFTFLKRQKVNFNFNMYVNYVNVLFTQNLITLLSLIFKVHNYELKKNTCKDINLK